MDIEMASQKWPTVTEIEASLRGGENVNGVVRRIEDEWINQQVKLRVLSEDILLDHHQKVRPVPYTVPYQSFSEICAQYFTRLSIAIGDDLYYSGKVLDMDALDAAVPHSTWPHFCRERIMVTYMERIEALKSRGDLWVATMESLRQIYEK